MKKLIIKIIPFADIFLLPFVFVSAIILKIVRMAGVQRLHFCKKALFAVGVFPIRNHYYEPQFDFSKIDYSLDDKRNLPGLDFNTAVQLEYINKLVYADELTNLPLEKSSDLEFHLNNGGFIAGDAEYWYQQVRAMKPKKIIEIGSGNSTLLAIKAIAKNKEENPDYTCDLICVEPYEQPWLEKTGATVIREKVEDLDLEVFRTLEDGDILFIDSSHVIRPKGDVLFEYLEILPSLKKGVVVHVHDIFSPHNYLSVWVTEDARLWNEQYLLEAFLTHNDSWEIIGSLNYLKHYHFDELKKVSPYLESASSPGSFYMRKTK